MCPIVVGKPDHTQWEDASLQALLLAWVSLIPFLSGHHSHHLPKCPSLTSFHFQALNKIADASYLSQSPCCYLTPWAVCHN